MNQKPGDLMLDVIDFFGILIPGAILTFLHGDLILGPLGLNMGNLQSMSNWIPAFFISFVLGHFLSSSISIPVVVGLDLPDGV